MNLTDWLPVSEFPGYSVNPLGQVRNDETERLLFTRQNQFGVPYVRLTRDLRQHTRSLPRLVATAFVPQPSKFFDTPINLDGNRVDCRASNLAWRPRWYAILYTNQFREEDPWRYEHPIEVPIKDKDTGLVFPDSLSAACHNGLLEREVVLSILNNTVTWPTFQEFELSA